jgi:hypothetical protein
VCARLSLSLSLSLWLMNNSDHNVSLKRNMLELLEYMWVSSAHC